MNGSASVNFLRNILDQTKSLQKEIAILIVANLKKETTPFKDYPSQSIITEYFSESELEEIATSFRSNNFFTDISTDEDDFIRKVQNKWIDKLPHKSKIVYNSAQKGTGPGRKALIPAYCNMNDIPLMGSNSYVRSLCRHKYHCYSLLKFHGLQQINSWVYSYKTGWILKMKPPVGKKVIVKPVYESASIGIDNNSVFIFGNTTEKEMQLISEKFEQPVIVQEFISGYEVEVPVFSDSVKTYCLGCIGISVNEKILLNDTILTYDIVYDDQYSFYNFGESVDGIFSKKISQCAINCAEILGIEGLGRIDFRVSGDGQYYITDIATNPHITKHSSFAYLLTMNKFIYTDLPILMLALAAKKYGWIS